jgi:GNAT superfamily N-acetyltransferase
MNTGIVIRPLAPGDEEALDAFFTGLSPETVRLRFGSGRRPRMSEIEGFTRPDPRTGEHLIALSESAEVVAHAMYVTSTIDPAKADAAVVVADAWQRRGVATALGESLAARAYAEGVRRFVALVAAWNTPMNSWLERHGATRLGTEMGQTDWVLALNEPV